jgi:tryptophan synthase alpha chain
MADGPVLQRAAARALDAGTTLPRVLELVARLRARMDVPLVLFGYYNPFFRYGVDKFARDAAAAGADGVLCVDLPPEEAGDLRAATDGAGLDVIRIARTASGFLYFVSVLGTTGARADLPPALPTWVQRARTVTPLPIGVGFGVSRPEQAEWIAGFADAVIVGSALARMVEESGRTDAPARVGTFLAALQRAMRVGASARTG